MLRHDLKPKNPRKYLKREESSYRNMMSRCYNKKATGYEFYGGRGILVCDRWKESFWNFYDDMGERPDGKSLDRINCNGNYELSNCRWATNKEQGNNTTKHYLLEYGGKTQNLSQWAEELHILPNTIYYRLARGWKPDEALGYIDRIPPWQGRLTPEQVTYVREQVEQGRTQIDLGLEVKLHSSQISRICNYKTKREKTK